MAYIPEEKLESIIRAIEKLEFGSLLITVHQGEITQLDVTEKTRFQIPKKSKSE
ncbi:YezD family protein [Halalkalibacterium ligniniphilum]|uniref:YezD family protein n=1 Tax=Halalkalibacterium ligniniphilum TaxID=1134413 RepID=UPI0003478D87|nr:YezD family protein [Halalkalibacterium ligniniphilum]